MASRTAQARLTAKMIFQATPEMRAAIVRIAQQEKISLGEVVRRLVEDSLRRRPDDELQQMGDNRRASGLAS